MDIIIKVHDTKDLRIQSTTQLLERLFRKYRINGSVVAVTESLEHCRLGIANTLPALELNGYVLRCGGKFTPQFLDDFCRRLANALD